MEDENIQTQPAHSKIHTWIIVLLGWIIVLSLVTIGVVLSKNPTTGMNASELANACQNAVVTGITQQTDTIADSCLSALEEGKSKSGQEPEQVQASSIMAGFDYPYDWTAFMLNTTHNDQERFTLFLDPDFVYICDDCDGPNTPIVVHTETKDPNIITQYGSYGEYWKNIYTSDSLYTNITISSKIISNGTIYTITGRSDGLGGPANFEKIAFEGSQRVVTVYHSVADDATETYQDEWTVVKDSLNFSLVE
ncbi:MAG: hypothetical protein UY72_C0015G0003 [Candidatus Uhrbacteria bacterium GW2011_GWD2_52_7]|uniref:Uncharacterized protein n=1 Tax=Candidatus Uhrbacteria bacterium GW2011_GWD2_52_7 TaxID=1618989 RepID=A0A0G1XH71_9BACT|nr:MAG: hypothetical protein UY72_C0015G0003 [Candidatus Uhrbacteria bacterium GW2011_GWD2_52_7]